MCQRIVINQSDAHRQANQCRATLDHELTHCFQRVEILASRESPTPEDLSTIRQAALSGLRLLRRQQFIFAPAPTLRAHRPRAFVDCLQGAIQSIPERSRIRFTWDEVSTNRYLAQLDSLREAFVLLLENAVSFSPPHTPVIAAASVKPERELEVSFTNSGSPPDAPFDVWTTPFWRSPGCNDSAGAGLGLAVVERIAEQHGAQLTAKIFDSNVTVVLTLSAI